MYSKSNDYDAFSQVTIYIVINTIWKKKQTGSVMKGNSVFIQLFRFSVGSAEFKNYVKFINLTPVQFSCKQMTITVPILRKLVNYETNLIAL